MRVLVDTNVLGHRLNRSSPDFASARQALTTLRADKHEIYTVPQVFYELHVVLTRPKTARNGFGLEPAKACRLAATLIRIYPPLPDPPELLEQWRQLFQSYRVSGVQAHDARLVAAAKLHRLTHILTFDVTDFARFAPENLTFISPNQI